MHIDLIRPQENSDIFGIVESLKMSRSVPETPDAMIGCVKEPQAYSAVARTQTWC